MKTKHRITIRPQICQRGLSTQVGLLVMVASVLSILFIELHLTNMVSFLHQCTQCHHVSSPGTSSLPRSTHQVGCIATIPSTLLWIQAPWNSFSDALLKNCLCLSQLILPYQLKKLKI